MSWLFLGTLVIRNLLTKSAWASPSVNVLHVPLLPNNNPYLYLTFCKISLSGNPLLHCPYGTSG